MAFAIAQATSIDQLDAVRALCREYANGLGVDLDETQNLSRELATLPGDYAPPRGCLLLAITSAVGEPAGCVAMRPLSGTICEMKRLYVRPAYRASGLGRELVRRVLDQARAQGYRAMRLDTLPERMHRAVALYREFGFVSIPAYWNNVLPGAAYMELELR